MSEHTPGPWFPHACIGLPDEDWWEIDTLERMPADAANHPPTGYRDIAIVPRRGAQDEANARLMASAPDMLATLLDIEDHLDGERLVAMHETPCNCRVCSYYLPLVRATIAKARGDVTPC